MSFARSAALVFVIFASFMPGCGGPKETPLLTVSGTVAVDGVPVDYGYISFFSLDDPGLGPQAGEIKDGKFECACRVGNMRIEIRATRPVKGTIARVEYIPARYNKASELTRQVSPRE